VVTTNTSKHKVTVKESVEGKPYLAFELLEGNEIPIIKDSNIGFFLEEGTSYEEAKELAGSINEKLSCLYITSF
jgi:hypothetical protein